MNAPIGISIYLIKSLLAAGMPDGDIQAIINASCREPDRSSNRGYVIADLPEKEWWPLRWKILERDDYTCAYCGFREVPKPYINGHLYKKQTLCADHVVPLSRGGTHDENNLVCACIPCNSSKNDRLLSEWQGRYR